MREFRWMPSTVVAVMVVACGGEATNSLDGGGANDGAGSPNSKEEGSESDLGAVEPDGTLDPDKPDEPVGDVCAQTYVSVESSADGEALSGCDGIAGSLDFRGGRDTPSLESIETITEKLHLQYSTVEDASVFTGLRDVGVLEIEGNGALTSLEGLENLETVWAGIYIHGNPALVDLSALHSVRLMGGPVQIDNNIRLPTCEVAALIAALTENGSNIEDVYEADTVPCQ